MLGRKNKTQERKRPLTHQSADKKVYSYYRNTRHTAEDASQERKKSSPIVKMARTIRRWSLLRWAIVIGVLIFIGAIIWVDTTPIIRVGDNDRPAREISQYRDSARDIISKNILNRTKLTFDYVAVENEFSARYPEVASIAVTFDLAGRKPVIQLTFHPPAVRVSTQGVIWIVDERGIAIAAQNENNLSVSTNSLPLVKDDINIGGEIGKSLLSAADVEYIRTLTDVITDKKLTNATLTLPLVPKELDVTLTGEGYRTKFNLDEDARGQAGTWLAARETLVGRGEIPTEYIDIRAGEKVFWK